MRIKELYQKGKPVLSFEIFPPKPDYPLDTVYRTIEGLIDLKPDFISVTYGAGGSNRVRTMEIASTIKKKYQKESLAHLTCVGHSPEELDHIIDLLYEEGIENVLALRGDPPRDQPDFVFKPGYYRYAAELVRHIRRKDNFCVGAAAYPEGHGQAPRWRDDWRRLKEKIDAGVDFLLTQLFFDNRIFYNFLEYMQGLKVDIPIVPGIMPVLNSGQIKRMIYLSGASIPAKLLKIFDRYEGSAADFEKAGIEYAVDQITDLLANGVPGIHLCTMNRVEQVREILKNTEL
ncbi:MAG: methylenetetrahydrofolate reductase [NAD(P)H] [Bacillota bacterium]